MKQIKLFAIALMAMFLLNSCNYLDIMPDETATEEDAFADAKAAERYLYSCYSYLPDPRNGVSSIDFFTADEVFTPFEHETFANFPKGNFTAANPVISYWNTLYLGIRQCYLLLESIDGVPGLDSATANVYKGEATFLIAYYHFLLLKNYGPVLLMDKLYPITTTVDEMPERTPYDECVTWIASKFDEAASMLPERRSGKEYGLATSNVAKSIKARMLLYAASPLFNGNAEYYSDLVSKVDGRNLMSLTYDGSKWERAAEANLEAIRAAEASGYSLYGATEAAAASLNTWALPTDPYQRAIRLNFIDAEGTNEIIWADTRGEGYYGLQNKAAPYQANASWNGVSPTLRFVEIFNTENGLPIDQDPDFDYNKRFEIINKPQHDINGETIRLHYQREPRFYAWISFHNGTFEIDRNDAFSLVTDFTYSGNCGIQGRTADYSPTGYLLKKGFSPAYSNDESTGIQLPPFYPWPIVRLAELYLNLAEALIEQPNPDLITARVYIDKVRERAGIPTVAESYANVKNGGWDFNTIDGMREIVRRERAIELYMENQRFWDIRRWKQGDIYFDNLPEGLNIYGTTTTDLFQRTEVVGERKFITPRHYLMPVPSTEVDKAEEKLVQNPGY